MIKEKTNSVIECFYDTNLKKAAFHREACCVYMHKDKILRLMMNNLLQCCRI